MKGDLPTFGLAAQIEMPAAGRVRSQTYATSSSGSASRSSSVLNRNPDAPGLCRPGRFGPVVRRGIREGGQPFGGAADLSANPTRRLCPASRARLSTFTDPAMPVSALATVRA